MGRTRIYTGAIIGLFLASLAWAGVTGLDALKLIPKSGDTNAFEVQSTAGSTYFKLITDIPGFLLTPTDTQPTSSEGAIYWDDSENALKVYSGASWTALSAGSGNNTLDQSYDQGGAGSGKAITADSGAVAISNTDADNAYLLTLSAVPGGAAASGGASITVGANSTEDCLSLANTGTGKDIDGTSGTWSVTKAGLLTVASFSNGGAATQTGVLTTQGDVDMDATGGSTSDPDLSVDGYAKLAGAVELGGAVTVDDGAGATSNFSFIDGSDETAILSKADTGYLQVTTDATDGLQVVTGNLKIGSGVPGTAAMNGVDFYVTGDSELDGAVQLDGALTLASTLTMSGKLDIQSGGELELSEGTTIDFQESSTFTLGADEYVLIDGSSTAQTQTAGALDLNFASITNGVSALNIAATQNDGATASETVAGLVLSLTGNDANGYVLGQTITAAATANAAAGTYRYGISFDCVEDTAGACIDGLIIASSGVNIGLTDGIDVSAANIANAINIGANPIVTGNVAGTLGDATTDSWTIQTDDTGDGSDLVLPAQGVGATEVLNDTLTFAQISDSSAVDVDTTFTEADGIELTITPSYTIGDSEALTVALSQADDLVATDDAVAVAITLASESDDTGDTIQGLTITGANGTANTIFDSAIRIDNAETTVATMTDGLVITSTGVDQGVTDAIDVSASNLLNSINIGANPIVTGNVAGTIGDSTTDSWTFVTDGTGDAEIALPENSIGPDDVAVMHDSVILCGEAAENGTNFFGPSTGAFGGNGADLSLASAACDALDNADEGTADAPLFTNVAFKITGLFCKTDGTMGAGESVVYTVRSAVAGATPAITCTVGVGETDCRSLTGSTTDIAASATIAIQSTQSSNNVDDNGWCKLYVAYK